MHTELRAWFDEHEHPAHATTRSVHAALVPVVELAAQVERQVVRYHELRRAAWLAEQPESGASPLATRPKIEWMRAHVDAVGNAVRALLDAAETLSATMLQLDHMMRDSRAAIEANEAAHAAAASAAPLVDGA